MWISCTFRSPWYNSTFYMPCIARNFLQHLDTPPLIAVVIYYTSTCPIPNNFPPRQFGLWLNLDFMRIQTSLIQFYILQALCVARNFLKHLDTPPLVAAVIYYTSTCPIPTNFPPKQCGSIWISSTFKVSCYRHISVAINFLRPTKFPPANKISSKHACHLVAFLDLGPLNHHRWCSKQVFRPY